MSRAALFSLLLSCAALVSVAAPADAQTTRQFVADPPGVVLALPDLWQPHTLPASAGANQWTLMDGGGGTGQCILLFLKAPPAEVWTAEQMAKERENTVLWQLFADEFSTMVKAQYPLMPEDAAAVGALDQWPVVLVDFEAPAAHAALGETTAVVGFGTRVAAGSVMFLCGSPAAEAARYRPQFVDMVKSVTFPGTP
jgi:hypothetical protein